METWEYSNTILRSEVEAQRGWFEERWPGREYPKYTVRALTPKLNEWGAAGWELVSIRPVVVGNNGDILDKSNAADVRWTHSYLCSFKRCTNLDGEEPAKQRDDGAAVDRR